MIQKLEEQIEQLGHTPSPRPQSPARSQRAIKSIREK